MTNFLDESQKAAITARIQQAERGTRGEIVTVIAGESDGYRYIPLLWAALVALSVPGLYYLYERLTTGGWQHTGESVDSLATVYPLQVLVFLGLGMLFQWPRLRLWLIPASVKRLRASRYARELFLLNKLHVTERRTGILLFVSVAEHHVEIIVDEGIAQVVDDAVWDEAVATFVAHVRAGRIAEGFESAIDRCRDVLWEHFPDDGGGRPDELPNHLIEV